MVGAAGRAPCCGVVGQPRIRRPSDFARCHRERSRMLKRPAPGKGDAPYGSITGRYRYASRDFDDPMCSSASAPWPSRRGRVLFRRRRTLDRWWQAHRRQAQLVPGSRPACRGHPHHHWREVGEPAPSHFRHPAPDGCRSWRTMALLNTPAWYHNLKANRGTVTIEGILGMPPRLATPS